MTSTNDTTNKSIDWRIVTGITISLVWMIVIWFLLFQKMSWQQFTELPLDQISEFLSGAFSPLAIVWLIVGFFIQQGEIAENARNIERQAEHSNLDNFLKMSELVYRHLGVITGYLYLSCRDDIQDELEAPIDFDDKWAKAGNGDYGIYARDLVRFRFREDGSQRDMHNIFFGTEIRTKHIENFTRIFQGLLDKAEDSDCTGSLYGALNEGTIWGMLLRIINETKTQPKNPS